MISRKIWDIFRVFYFPFICTSAKRECQIRRKIKNEKYIPYLSRNYALTCLSHDINYKQNILYLHSVQIWDICTPQQKYGIYLYSRTIEFECNKHQTCDKLCYSMPRYILAIWLVERPLKKCDIQRLNVILNA